MIEILYLVAAVAFIVGLKQLGHPRTARAGNRLASIGMLLAIVITLISEEIINWGTLAAGLVLGAALGAWFAVRVQMTSMPQMVAAFNGFGGFSLFKAWLSSRVERRYLGRVPSPFHRMFLSQTKKQSWSVVSSPTSTHSPAEAACI